MNKLFSSRECLSLQETQDYLSNVLKEPVSLEDIYGLILDGSLTLSVRLIAQLPALKGIFIEREPREIRKLTTELADTISPRYGNFLVESSQNEQFVHDRLLHHINGLWDIVMRCYASFG